MNLAMNDAAKKPPTPAGKTPSDAANDGAGKPASEHTTADAAWAIVSYQLAGMAVWGGIGWLLDRWTGHTALFLPIGVIVGIVGALYLIFARYYRS